MKCWISSGSVSYVHNSVLLLWNCYLPKQIHLVFVGSQLVVECIWKDIGLRNTELSSLLLIISQTLVASVGSLNRRGPQDGGGHQVGACLWAQCLLEPPGPGQSQQEASCIHLYYLVSVLFSTSFKFPVLVMFSLSFLDMLGLCIILFPNIYLMFWGHWVLVIFSYFLLHMKCQINSCHVLAGELRQMLYVILWAAHDGNCWVLVGWIPSSFSQS